MTNKPIQAIPLKYLPKEQREAVATRFGLSTETIKKIANRSRNNPEVFKALLDVAQVEKERESMQNNELDSQLKKLIA